MKRTLEAPARGVTSRGPSVLGSVPWASWLVAVMAATLALYGVDILFQPLPSAVSEMFQKFAASVNFFGAAVLCFMRGRGSRDERVAWWLFALAMALWGSGSVYFSIALWDRDVVPLPSVADGFWLAFYLCAFAAILSLLRRRAGSLERGVWLDAVVGALGVGGASAALVFGVVLDGSDGTAIATATNLAYPVGDLGLLALVVAAMTIVGWKACGVWLWIAPAFALFALADSVYLVQVGEGTYAIGGVFDLGWPAAALLVGLGAWRAKPGLRAGVRTEAMLVVPGVFGLSAIGLLVADHFVRMNGLALGLATGSVLVMLVRLCLTVLDNSRLLARSRREASTDALTGLGNRRRLTADLADHLRDLDPDRPLLLTLFDLDGFKQYNDTFGHLAGDQLLERLGARLSDLVAGRGTAYRMGGDEFCVLWTDSDAERASVTTMEAVAALSESGGAFKIGCSYGSTLLPNETSDSTEALRIADRRMYVRKGSRGGSAGRQSCDVLLRVLGERDSELGDHVYGVADLACATATGLRLFNEPVEATRQTALLHDVGKVAIPDAILDKPGPLDESEWAFMRQHTIIGERIIAAAPALADVARYVRSTHERYDGAGYPDGLAGDEIPLPARIVAVCDAYHAIISKRAYRVARDRSKAIVELRLCSGTQFDPRVVEAFVGALEMMDEPVLEPSRSDESPTGLGHVLSSKQLLELMRSGLDEDGFVVHGQSIVDIATGEHLKHELTLQLPAGDGRLLTPAEFLPAAEQFGLVTELDDLLIGRAVTLAGGGHSVAVDVSAASLADPDLTRRVEQAVTGAQVEPGLLTFELSEEGLAANARAASAFVWRVGALRCSVTVDHCGSGHQGFGYLKGLPVSCLKIDAEFIAGLDASSSKEQLVEAVVYLAKGLGIATAAEGVSDPSTRALLEDLGVDHAQGDLFGVPTTVTHCGDGRHALVGGGRDER